MDHVRGPEARRTRAAARCTTASWWASARCWPTIRCCCRRRVVRRPFPRVVVRLALAHSAGVAARRARAPVGRVGRALRRHATPPRSARSARASGLAGPAKAGRLELAAGLRRLRGAGLWSLMVEGGVRDAGSLPRGARFRQVALFRAPLLLGGRDSRPAFGGPDPRHRGGRRALIRRASPRSPALDAARRPLRGLGARTARLDSRLTMFTGIVEEIGTVGGRRRRRVLRVAIDGRGGRRPACGRRLDRRQRLLSHRGRGRTGEDSPAQLTGETLARTSFESRLGPGAAVNLERALRGERPARGPHRPGPRRRRRHGRPRCAPRGGSRASSWWTRRRSSCVTSCEGSVAVDGVSLTVARLDRGRFARRRSSRIHWTERTSPRRRPGDPVNLETDVLAQVRRAPLGHGRSRVEAP